MELFQLNSDIRCMLQNDLPYELLICLYYALVSISSYSNWNLHSILEPDQLSKSDQSNSGNLLVIRLTWVFSSLHSMLPPDSLSKSNQSNNGNLLTVRLTSDLQVAFFIIFIFAPKSSSSSWLPFVSKLFDSWTFTNQTHLFDTWVVIIMFGDITMLILCYDSFIYTTNAYFRGKSSLWSQV